jgi:hypothetical protein
VAISVSYGEMLGSPTENQSIIAPGHFTAIRRLMCAWDDRQTLRKEILTYPDSLYPDTYRPEGLTGVAIKARIDPHPGRITGVDSGTLASYDYAVLTVTYASLLMEYYGQPDKLFMRERMQPTTEFLTDGTHYLFWDDGTRLPDDQCPQRLYRSFDLVRTYYQIPIVPAAVMSLVGCCNSDVVPAPFLGLSFPAQTLLWQPCTTNRTLMASGNAAWNATFRLSYRPNGWNKFWNPGANKWSFLYLDANKTTQYVPHPPSAFGVVL